MAPLLSEISLTAHHNLTQTTGSGKDIKKKKRRLVDVHDSPGSNRRLLDKENRLV
jgi:hypothetical protein